MKSILMSIQKPHNTLIERNDKKYEFRTVIPQIEPPFKVFTYESKARGGRGAVTNEWICDGIIPVIKKGFVNPFAISGEVLQKGYISNEFLLQYSDNYRKDVFALHISDLKVYDKPKELGEFRKPCGDCLGKCTGEHYNRCPWQTVIRPPQSWQYVEVPNEE